MRSRRTGRARLAGHLGRDHHARHRGHVGQLGQAGHHVADGKDSRLPGLHPLVDPDETALHLDLGGFEAKVSGAGGAADGYQHRLRLLRHLLAIRAREGHLHAVVGLLHLVHFGAGVGVDASLAKDPGQFLAHVLIFVGDQARQVLDDGDLTAKALEDGAELDPHSAGADHHHGLGYLGQGEDLNIGQDAVRVRFHAGQHARVGAGGDHYILGLDDFLLPAGCLDRDGMNSIFRRAGELAVALDGGDLVLAHEKVETLHMLGDDPVLAIENGLPVDSDLAHAFNAVLGGVLQVVIDLGVEEQGLGGNAAHVQASASQLSFPARSGQPSTHTARRGWRRCIRPDRHQ